MLAGAENHGRDREMDLVHEACLQILANRRDPAPEPDVLPARGRPRLIQNAMTPAGDEAKLRSAGHAERRASVMGEHEDGRVIGRALSPPASPGLVGPWSADRPEHVPPHD